jgi:hypothetical protein
MRILGISLAPAGSKLDLVCLDVSTLCITFSSMYGGEQSSISDFYCTLSISLTCSNSYVTMLYARD